ncbi:MAG: hypothetical protein V8R80_02985 [Eubacterium sp.]
MIPANYPHNTISFDETESYWEYVFVDVERILMTVYPDDILFGQKMLEKINKKAYMGKKEDVELSKLVQIVLDGSGRKGYLPGEFRRHGSDPADHDSKIKFRNDHAGGNPPQKPI